MAALSIADLFEIAKLFFGESMCTDIGGSHAFFKDTRRQYITLTAIKDFTRSDGFFRAFGDTPMPSYTPPGLPDILKSAGNYFTPAKLEDRIRSNVLVRRAIHDTYLSWWQNPELFVR
jgi:hypothetical protein